MTTTSTRLLRRTLVAPAVAIAVCAGPAMAQVSAATPMRCHATAARPYEGGGRPGAVVGIGAGSCSPANRQQVIHVFIQRYAPSGWQTFGMNTYNLARTKGHNVRSAAINCRHGRYRSEVTIGSTGASGVAQARAYSRSTYISCA